MALPKTTSRSSRCCELGKWDAHKRGDVAGGARDVVAAPAGRRRATGLCSWEMSHGTRAVADIVGESTAGVGPGRAVTRLSSSAGRRPRHAIERRARRQAAEMGWRFSAPSRSSLLRLEGQGSRRTQLAERATFSDLVLHVTWTHALERVCERRRSSDGRADS